MLFHVIDKNTKQLIETHATHKLAFQGALWCNEHEVKCGRPAVYAVRASCSWCDRINEDDPSDFYHRSMCEARYLRDCLTRETDPEAIRKLKKRLERALYVGD